MEPIYIVLIIIACLLFLFLGFEYVMYYKTFYNNLKNKKTYKSILKGKDYDKYQSKIDQCVEHAKTYPYQDVDIRGFRKIKLHARFYQGKSDNPYVICIHGYKGNAINNFAVGMPFYVDKGYNVLLVDNRGHGLSQGHTATFGILDRKDVRKWIDYLIQTYGQNIKIIITGISMGGGTTLMMGSTNLPKNVIGLIADCPYANVKDEIKYCLKQRLHLPEFFIYPIYLSALIYGHFNINETDAYRSIAQINLPILIIHGDRDRLVPISASISVKNKFPEQVTFVQIKDAAHGLSFIVDRDTYTNELNRYLDLINQ